MKKTVAVLALVLSGGVWAAFGPSNTIILSGWPVADTSVSAESAEIVLAASGASAAASPLTVLDGRAFSMDIKAFEGGFSSLPPGLTIIVR